MNILILGAAGQIARILTQDLLRQTDHRLKLYARNASRRLKLSDPSRDELYDGDFLDATALLNAMHDVDIVYINDMGTIAATQMIVETMQAAGVERVIAASILGIYDEVGGAFRNWNNSMIGGAGTERQARSAEVLENSNLDYTLLRLTWLYNDEDNRRYSLTQKGEPFIGAQVTRQAVSQLIVDIIECPDRRFSRSSIGVSEPDTDWPKPSFY
ncbi:NAD(P)H-binding protein [Bartonella sp. LJL80]